MAEKKPRRKELLKEPDEFITWSARAVAFTRNNPRTIGLAASLIVVVGLASLAYYGYQNRRQSAAHEMLESAVRTYEILSVSENSKRYKLIRIFFANQPIKRLPKANPVKKEASMIAKE